MQPEPGETATNLALNDDLGVRPEHVVDLPSLFTITVLSVKWEQ